MKRVVMIWLMNLFLSLGSWSKQHQQQRLNNWRNSRERAQAISQNTHRPRAVCRPHCPFSSNQMVKRKCTASSAVCCYLFKEQQVLVSNYSIDSPIMFRLFRRIIENHILLRYLRCRLEKNHTRAQTRHKANKAATDMKCEYMAVQTLKKVKVRNNGKKDVQKETVVGFFFFIFECHQSVVSFLYCLQITSKALLGFVALLLLSLYLFISFFLFTLSLALLLALVFSAFVAHIFICLPFLRILHIDAYQAREPNVLENSLNESIIISRTC